MAVDRHVAEDFVKWNWLALAASAWRFHLHFGPGALVVEWVVVQRWAKDLIFPYQLRYATDTENADFNAVIAGYDPRTDVVIAFSDEGRGGGSADQGTALAAMTFTADPPPPDAHRARGH